MTRNGLSPLQLAWISLVGCTIFPLFILSARLHVLPTWVSSQVGLNHTQMVTRGAIILCAFFVSAGLWFAPFLKVRKGLSRQKWSKVDVNRLQQLMQFPVWNGIIIACVIGILVSFVAGPGNPLNVILLFPEMAIVQWKNLMRPQSVEQRSMLGL